MPRFLIAILIATGVATSNAQTITGHCILTSALTLVGLKTLRVELTEGGCSRQSGSCVQLSDSGLDWNRWSGVTAGALVTDGAVLNAKLSGDAGELTCEGTSHAHQLSGRFDFTANPDFERMMGRLGYTGITPQMQLSMLVLDVTTAWSSELKAAGVIGLSAGELISFKALHLDISYIHALASVGYPELRASKLIEMKSIGVTPESVREAKEMGFQPSEEQLIQMVIFKIDPVFVERMQAKGIKDLSLSRLITIKTFGLQN